MRRGGIWAAAALVAGGATALGGCAQRYLAVDQSGHTTAVAPVTTAAPTPGDTCGASKLQYLVGKPQTQIPVPADLSHQRVACTACVLSHLDDPRRVTIRFDQTSGLVTKVICQ